MPDNLTYEYAIIRVVPRVERQEFFNVGVLLYAKRNRFLGIKYHICPQKLNAFSKDLNVSELENYLNAWALICEGNLQGNTIEQLDISDRFRWLAASKSTVIQCSPTHVGICTNPKETLEGLFTMFVE
ncbi:DUF3037 domain-containing protein [Bizionia sediminis]|uniref:DUF3037 domain-containing protein n=1 Tax=Bizionia sediminis TaxID=1737064 RepID=A0ABW5KWS4_9FLAO